MIDWKPSHLSDIITIKHGWAFKGEFFSEEPTDDILLTPGNFLIGGGFKSDKFKYYNGEVPSSYILKPGDVIVTMTDLSKQADTLGFSAKVPDDKNKRYLHNQRIGLVGLKNNDFDLEYIYWLLRTVSYQKFVAGSATGATVKHTSPTKIYYYKFFAPKLKSTQKRIASILSAYDDLIENNLKRIKLLEEIAQRTYEEWFVKFMVNGEQLAIDEVTGLPEGWEIIKVGDLLDKVQSTIKIPSSEILSEGIIPVIDQSRDFVAGYTNEKLSMTSLSKPIIVFGDHTRVLKFIDFPFARGADGTQLILSKNNRMPQHLFYHSLLNIDLSNYHYARHFKYLKDSEIILPIEKYSNKYEGLIKPIFEKIKVLRFQNVKLKQSRDILLPRLMSGTINVES